MKKIKVNNDTLRYVCLEVIYKITRAFLYHQNTTKTRQLITTLVMSMLDSFKECGLLNDYKVDCNEENNTVTMIDNHELKLTVAYQKKVGGDWIVNDFHPILEPADIDVVSEEGPDSFLNNRFEVIKDSENKPKDNSIDGIDPDDVLDDLTNKGK